MIGLALKSAHKSRTYNEMMGSKLAKILAFTLASAMVVSCGGSGDEPVNRDFESLRVYKSDSPYQDTAARCARAESNSQYCTLATLPLLGIDYSDPGIPQIMERVVVSHAWMGERFEELLYELPQELLPLFRSVTAIVIDDDIRPAYYSPGTGAIYLDPAFLWLTVAEKQTINPKQDYRAGFDDPLAFRQLNRYTKDGALPYRHLSLLDESTRELDDIVLLIARLLLHELAHANDFFPPDLLYTLPLDQKPYDTALSIESMWVSRRLSDDMPLSSNTMFSLAGVMYRGDDPSVSDLAITASEVGDAFEPDGAGDDYGYSSENEDLAMLFETSMMKYFFDADYELAFTDVPEDLSLCSSYQIGWGIRNRFAHEMVIDRAQFAVNNLLPDLDIQHFFDTTDPATEISGDWCLEASNSDDQQKPQFKRLTPIERLRPYL